MLLAHRLLQTEEERALFQAIRPLATNPDCHFLAVLRVLVQSILEGSSWKTRAAAAMIAGLLVMDPTLKVMVVTKENAAAHAFAKHIEFLHKGPGEQLHAKLLSIPSCHVAEDTHLEHLPVNKFSLTPRRIPVERKASADKSRVDLDMVASEESGSEAESGGQGCLTIPLLIRNAPT